MRCRFRWPIWGPVGGSPDTYEVSNQIDDEGREWLSGSRYKILLAARDRGHREFLAANLTADGYDLLIACSCEQALGLLGELPDLVLVDLDGDTLALVDAVRGGAGVGGRIDSGVGIVVLSGSADELHSVRCLQRGADDIVGKSVSYAEVRERVAAVLRRCCRDPTRAVVRAGPLTIDAAARTIDVAGRPVGLSRLEFDLLLTLAANAGRVFTREELLRVVWGYPTAARSRTLDAHVARLRAKLRGVGVEHQLVSVRGVGYRLDDGRVGTAA
jgi:DNA-binding response OmpR family regulator